MDFDQQVFGHQHWPATILNFNLSGEGNNRDVVSIVSGHSVQVNRVVQGAEGTVEKRKIFIFVLFCMLAAL